MNFFLGSIVYAALTSSVKGFISPSHIATRSNAFAHENAFIKTVPLVESGLCKVTPSVRSSNPSCSLLKAAGDEVIDVILKDSLYMSGFVYTFRQLRGAVLNNPDVPFVRPELIITQSGSQESDENQYFKYDVTPAAILTFVESNRKFLKLKENGDFEYDEDQTENKKAFDLEDELKVVMQENFKMIDYDDQFSTNNGGLVYGIIINLTRKWMTVVFRGTFGATDVLTDRKFGFDYDSFFPAGSTLVKNGKPATHNGFTSYLVSRRSKRGRKNRPYMERITACLNDEFENNVDVVGKDFKLYITGHSLGASLANLFAFNTARAKYNDDESVKHLPAVVNAVTFASPVAGNDDYNKEFQFLEKDGVLRHIRVSNYGDVIPTNEITLPYRLALQNGSGTGDYTQNGVNMYLQSDGDLELLYRNTRGMAEMPSFFNPKKTVDTWLKCHSVDEYKRRVGLPCNQKYYEKTIDEIYDEHAGTFSN